MSLASIRTARRVAALPLLALALVACSGTQRRPAPTTAVAYRFRCTPRDARVIVDEVDQGACILWEGRYLGLGTGSHRLRVEREGFFPLERELPATGRRESVEIRLREVPE